MLNDYTKIVKQLTKYKQVEGLMKYINYESLIEQHRRQERNKAPGIDNINKTEYGKEIEQNIEEILYELKNI